MQARNTRISEANPAFSDSELVLGLVGPVGTDFGRFQKELFSDSITLGKASGNCVHFEQFVGVGPRRFIDLFSIGLSSGTTVKRKQAGVPIKWTPKRGLVRVPLLPNSYLNREQAAADELLALTTTPEGSA